MKYKLKNPQLAWINLHWNRPQLHHTTSRSPLAWELCQHLAPRPLRASFAARAAASNGSAVGRCHYHFKNSNKTSDTLTLAVAAVPAPEGRKFTSAILQFE